MPKTVRRVGVCFDWENTVLTAAEVLPYGHDPRCDNLSPTLLARRLTALVNTKTGYGAELSEVFVAAGIHSRFRHPHAHEQRRRQVRAWSSDPRVRVETRELLYPEHGGCREPADIDQLVREHILRTSRSGQVDLLIVVTNDKQVGAAARHALLAGRIKVNAAVWGDRPSAFAPNGMHVHHLDEDDYRRCSTPATFHGAA